MEIEIIGILYRLFRDHGKEHGNYRNHSDYLVFSRLDYVSATAIAIPTSAPLLCLKP